jgi:hypothetical protein
MNLTPLQRKLCNTLQQGLPVCEQPFTEVAKSLGCEEQEVYHLHITGFLVVSKPVVHSETVEKAFLIIPPLTKFYLFKQLLF